MMTGILRDVNDIPTIYVPQSWADPYAFDLVEESLPGQVKRAGTSVIESGFAVVSRRELVIRSPHAVWRKVPEGPAVKPITSGTSLPAKSRFLQRL